MRQTQRSSDSISTELFNVFIYRMLTLLALIILILSSSSSFAFKDNPGSAKNCSSGSVKGIFDKTNYNKLKTSFDTNTYQSMNSGASASSIPLKIKMIINDINVNTTGNTNTVTGTNANPAIDINRNFKNLTSSSDITLDFQNTENNTSLYLGNVALSVFDIDKSIDRNKAGWDDLVSITGITRNNINIKGAFQGVSGSSVIELANGLQNSSTDSSFNCTSSLDTNCQGSVLFSEDVRSVTLSYTNTNNVTNPTSQRFQFRVDSYCYTPQYTFSGTVFNDNGGMDDVTQADASNSNIGVVPYNNTNYFNGVFNFLSPNAETGIEGSTVELTHCTNGSVYSSQLVNNSVSAIGQYKINVPSTTINGNTNNLCLLESRPGNTYPIRTSTDSIKVNGFSTTKYDYPNNNFGRVIAENAALVLRKAQYVNNCRADINYTDSNLNIAGNTNPNTGFSEDSITDNLNPGQCIAYRITATNRANSPINNFVMQDKLQKKGPGGALVTSVLANPISNTVDYASDSVPIGQNGIVKTNSFVLPLRSKRVFYFNTKYGTTVDP